MDVRKIVGLAVLVGGVGLSVGCAASGNNPGDDDGDDDGISMRPDAADFVADDGAVLGESTLIDDLEDGDAAIHEILGRIGAWYSFNDGTAGGTQMPSVTADFVPAAGGAKDSGFAARTSGKGFKEWGAGLGVDLNSPGPASPGAPDLKGKYDASSYTGIAFEAKGTVSIRFQVATFATVPMADGGGCTPSDVEGKMCDDGHGKSIALGSSWKTFEIPFKDLKQGGWGLPADFDAKSITGMLFLVGQNLEFDYSIDNVRFYKD